MIHDAPMKTKPDSFAAGGDFMVVGVYARSPQPRDGAAPPRTMRARRRHVLQALFSSAAAAGTLAFAVTKASVVG